MTIVKKMVKQPFYPGDVALALEHVVDCGCIDTTDQPRVVDLRCVWAYLVPIEIEQEE